MRVATSLISGRRPRNAEKYQNRNQEFVADFSGAMNSFRTLVSEEYAARDVAKIGVEVRAMEAAQNIERFMTV